MTTIRLLPSICPSCGQLLSVKRLECPQCETAVEGTFRLPTLLRLTPEEQELALCFIKCGGALKDLARVYGLSYPTVRNRLDALIERVRQLEAPLLEAPLLEAQCTGPREDNNHEC